MRFEKIVNIYAPDAILKRFRAAETSIEVTQGKIGALITESELVELTNSRATMYSKLASAVLEIDALQLDFSDLTTKYNTVTGQYSALDSKVAQYKLGVDGLSADIAAVRKNIQDNYSTTTAMNSAINLKAGEITSSVSQTYAKQSDLAAANGKLATLESWKTEASQKITAEAIVNTVTASGAWAGKADKGTIISQINQSAEAIAISASKIKLEGLVTANGNFKILTDGSMEALNGTFKGDILVGYMGAENNSIRIYKHLASGGYGQVGKWDKDGISISGGTINIFGQQTGTKFYVSNLGVLETVKPKFSGTMFMAQSSTYYPIARMVGGSLYLGSAAALDAENKINSLYVKSAGYMEINSGNNMHLSASSGITLSSSSGINISGKLKGSGAEFSGYVEIYRLKVTGEKNRVVQTEHYGKVLQNAYETAEPMFGDIGHNVVGQDGSCVVQIESKFAETVNTACGYYVFLTRCGAGDIWVEKKERNLFVVCGTPGLGFDWEIKAHQKGYEHHRLEAG